MHENPSDGYLIEAIELKAVLPSEVQEEYEQLVCDLECEDAETLLRANWPQALPPVEEIFLFGADDTPDPELEKEVPYARFDQGSLFTLVASPALVRLTKAGVRQPSRYSWTMFG